MLYNVFNVFSLCRYHLPLKKGVAHHSNKLDFPLPRVCQDEVWVKLSQRFWSGQEDENVKSLLKDRQMDR